LEWRVNRFARDCVSVPATKMSDKKDCGGAATQMPDYKVKEAKINQPSNDDVFVIQ